MKITAVHLQFWQAKKFGKPSFASHLEMHVPSVHKLININAGIKSSSEPHNTMVTLRGAIRRGVLVESLKKMAMNPNCNTNPARRAASCRKWLDRIEK
jgi:hypothetical protein